MSRIRAAVGGLTITADVDRQAPLGWRFWTLAGFPGDPVQPRPYGASRCIPLAMVEIDGCQRWLCAMELDGTFQLFTGHELFPCADQAGAARFARAVIDSHAVQLRLL
ncbi:transposase [Sphingobium sp. H39-3-25]|uniref:hypothetical protein n=1 Tax=Sphingomonadales TaxID=204457 RepID=UPI0006184A4B|nr:hypothetical protein [Sphingomonas sp. SRS2]KKC25052.1 transposase [Sphingomonas sp. SRS2]MDF0546599.1 transposase [Sphingobium arseniciresistens]